MAITQLIDVSNCKINSTALGRPVSVSFRDEAQTVRSASDVFLGAYSEDITRIDSKATIETQDPLALPTVLALTFPLSVNAEGRVVNAGTYQKHTLAHGILTGFALTIIENQPGTLRLEFVNRASTGVISTTLAALLATEHIIAAGSAASAAARGGVVKFAPTGNSFTPSGGGAISLAGIEQLTMQGRADVEIAADSGSVLSDIVDVTGWTISGSLSLRDRTITSALVTPQTLGTAIRGTLVLQVQQTGKLSDASPGDDQVITLPYLQFVSPGEDLRTKQRTSGTVNFNQILRDGSTAKAIDDMITIAAAA